MQFLDNEGGVVVNLDRWERSAHNPILTPGKAFNWEMEGKGVGSIMFPTVIPTPSWLLDQYDPFLMYYASHNGNGIGLATAPTPEGPWTPHNENPVLHLNDTIGLKAHISSPEILVNVDKKRLRLFFHGPLAQGGGQGTCVAESDNGREFKQDLGTGVVIPPIPGTWRSRMSAYFRIFMRGDQLYGLLMGHDGTVVAPGCSCNHQGLFRSRDGIVWEEHPSNPVLSPDPSVGDHGTIRHVGMFQRGDTVWIGYSTRNADLSVECIKLARWDVSSEEWTQWPAPERLGPILEPVEPWEGTDLRDPYFLLYDDTLYLYYAGGMESGIGVAKYRSFA